MDLFRQGLTNPIQGCDMDIWLDCFAIAGRILSPSDCEWWSGSWDGNFEMKTTGAFF